MSVTTIGGVILCDQCGVQVFTNPGELPTGWKKIEGRDYCSRCVQQGIQLRLF